jgi:hypothetical protein
MEKIKKFINSDLFIIFTYLLTIICWYFKNQTIAIIYYALLVLVIILLNCNRINIITLLMAAIINYRETSYEGNVWLFVIAAAAILPFVIFDIFRKKVQYQNNIFLSMLLLLAVNLLSLINTNRDNISYGLVGVSQYAGFCFLFFYLMNKRQDNDYRYVAKNAAILSLAISAQIIIFLINFEGDILDKEIALGWGATNSIAITYMLLLPMIFYLYVENQKRVDYLLLLILDVAMIILTFCKGAYLTIAILIIPFLIIAYKRAANKRLYIVQIALSAVLLFGILYSFYLVDHIREGFLKYFGRMDERGWFNDTARIEISKYGAEIFKDFPLFGSGSYTAKPYLILHGYHPNLKHYHNYIIQTLATLGITGLLAFGVYIYHAIKGCMNRNFFNTCVLFAILAMLIHGIVDNTWYNAIIMVIITVYLAVLAKNKEHGQIEAQIDNSN